MNAALEARAFEEIRTEDVFVRPPKFVQTAPIVQRADELLARQFDPVRWAIRDLLPEGVTIVVGPPKVGKSWLMLQAEIAVADGLPLWAGRKPEQSGDVLMLALEDNDRRLQARMTKLRESNIHKDCAGRDAAVRRPDVSRLHFATEWPRMDQGGLAHLDAWLEQHPDARLVVIDTLARFRPPDTGRGSAYQSDYAVGAALKPLAERHRVAIVLVHHTRKMVATDVLDTVSGTQGLTGSVDALLVLRRERGQMDAALYVTGRDIEHEQDYALTFDAQSCTWSSIGTVHAAGRTRERRAVLDFLDKNGPGQPKDIAKGLDKKGPATRRLLQKLFADGDVRLDDGKYSLIHTYGNGGNSSNGRDRGDNADAGVTSATEVTRVTAVTTPDCHASTEETK